MEEEMLMSKFRDIVNYQINRLNQGLSLQIDISIMKDLIWWAEMGVFEVVETEPILEEDDTLRISKKVGLFWKGEEELKRLRKENIELNIKIEKIKKELEF